MNWSDYSYASDGSIMIVLIIILGALAAYLLLDKRTRTDKWSSKQNAWSGEDIQPEYNAGQEDVSPFDDPEVPSKPKKPKKKKKKTVAPKKRGYLPVVRNQKKKKKTK